ncbi:MAG: hypothetical protein LBP95_14050, partial [Deltaproteobacteria bacterium]|nr:hypothetical protein [Deltaproteobacteria bacterium]
MKKISMLSNGRPQTYKIFREFTLTTNLFDGMADGILDFQEGGAVKSLTDLFIKNLKRPDKP